MNYECWAACLGSCDGVLSREHIVNKSLFISPSVEVTGFPWCKGETKRIGLESLTKRALCVKHNNDLSPLDAVGAHAFDVLRQQTKLANDSAQRTAKENSPCGFSPKCGRIGKVAVQNTSKH